MKAFILPVPCCDLLRSLDAERLQGVAEEEGDLLHCHWLVSPVRYMDRS